MAAPLITDPPRPPTSYRQARKNQRAAQARIQERLTAIDQQILECEDPEKTLKLFGTKQLLENMYGWDGDFGGSDVWYELRGQGTDDPTRWVPLSVPSDRRHGTNWPIWRWDQDLDRLRNMSRMLCTQNAYARGLLRNLTNFTIGKGFAYKAQPKKDLPPEKAGSAESLKTYTQTVQEIVDKFLARNHWNGPCDPRQDGSQPTGTREREAYRRVHRDGEALLRFFFQDDGETDVRFVEPEQLRNPGQRDPDGDSGDYSHGWTFGIKHQMEPYEDTETVLMYHFAYQDSATAPGKDNLIGEFVDAAEVVHIKHPDTDMATKRGIPSFSWESAQAFVRASKLQKNMSIAASVRAATAEIWKHTYGTQSQISQLAAGFQASTITDEATGLAKTMERVWPGMIRRVPYGQEPVQVPENNATAQHQLAAQGDLRQGSAAFCAPEYLTGDASNANYSSTQEAGAPFVNNSEAEQEYFKAAFLTCVWKAVAWAIECKQVPAEVLELIEIQVEAPQVKRADELQKAQKDQILVTMGAKSPQTVAMENGLDPETEAGNNEEHAERFGEPGQPLGMPDEEGNLPPNDESGDPFAQQAFESALFESGFSGEITDRLGRKVTYQNGKRVAKAGGKSAAKSTGSEWGDAAAHAAKLAKATQTTGLKSSYGTASDAATKATQQAGKANSHEGHMAAAQAHAEAAKAHSKAYDRMHQVYDPGTGGTDMGLQTDRAKHGAAAEAHSQAAEHHKAAALKLKASSSSASTSNDAQSPTPEPQEYVDHAESEVPKTLEKAAGLKGKFKAAFSAIKNKAVGMYKKLEAKHGKAGAIAILAAGHALGLATPLAVIPGSTFLATAAVAYAYDAAKKGLKAAGAIESLESEGPTGETDVEDLARQLLADLMGEAKAALKEAEGGSDQAA